MTNPYHALCAELVDELEDWIAYGDALAIEKAHNLVDRARAALAQPEPEGPTDEEIEEWADACSEAPLEEMDPEVHGWRRCFTAKEFSETIRAALDRWGNSQGILDSSPQPVAVSERLPGPEDCDEQGRCWWFRPATPILNPYWDFTSKPDYPTHWLPANAIPTPEATND